MVHAMICDFDFTLADSSPGVVACVNEALAGLGLPPASAERIHATIGLSRRVGVPCIAVLTGMSDVPSFAPYPVHSFLADVIALAQSASDIWVV